MNVYSRRLKVQEPYNAFTIRAGSAKPATELQFQMYSNKLQLGTDTDLRKRVLSHYDVFVPPNLQFGNDWTKYNFGELLYSDDNNNHNPLNTTLPDWIYSYVAGKQKMPLLHQVMRVRANMHVDVNSVNIFSNYATIHNWYTFKGSLNVFCMRYKQYGGKGMSYNCYYLPAFYKEVIENSYFYKQNNAAIVLTLLSIDYVIANTKGSNKSKESIKALLTHNAPERTQLVRVEYIRDFQLVFDNQKQFTANNKTLYCDYFCYYLGDPYNSSKNSPKINVSRRLDLFNVPRVKQINATKSSDLNFFKTTKHQQAFVALLNGTSFSTSGSEPSTVVDVNFDKKWMAWSWQRFQDISPSKPSLNHLLKPYFIYQNDCKRRIVTGKQEGYTIISSGQLDFSKPYTQIDTVNYESMVVDCRVSGIIRDDVFSDEISFKIVDLLDRAPPAFIPTGKTEKLPFRSVLIAYSSAEMPTTYRNLDALSFTSFPTVTENKKRFRHIHAQHAVRRFLRTLLSTQSIEVSLQPGQFYHAYDAECQGRGLGDARELLVDGKQYRILGIINLSYEKRWKALKDTDNHFTFSFMDDSLAAPNGQGSIDVANLGMSFITNNYSDLAAFNVYLVNSAMKPLGFGSTTKVPIINYTVSVMDSSVRT